MKIEHIIKQYGKFIKSQIYLYNTDANFINEIYQNVLLRLWQSVPETLNFKYLSKLVKFAIIDNYRRNKKVIKILPIEHFEFIHEDCLIEDIESELQSLLCKIDRLKESQRDVVLLRLAGYSFKQIAKIMDITQNNAIGQMYYAKKNLCK
jgi:RNA polymerase sigma factor (sigma-70 family)